MERCCGRDLGDYTGIGINDEARAKALSWDASLNSLRERQCLLFSPWTGQFQPQGVRIWSEIDNDGNVIAWNLSGNVQKDIVTIWMDGRPHPSANAFHDFSGFTTGKWEGDTLIGVHHPHEDRDPQAIQRHPQERSRDRDRAHHEARRPVDDRDDRGRPDLPGRAAVHQPHLPAGSHAATSVTGISATR